MSYDLVVTPLWFGQSLVHEGIRQQVCIRILSVAMGTLQVDRVQLSNVKTAKKQERGAELARWVSSDFTIQSAADLGARPRNPAHDLRASASVPVAGTRNPSLLVSPPRFIHTA